MAREWRTNTAPEDLERMSVIDLLRLIQVKTAAMDDQHPTVQTLDEAVILLQDHAKVVVAAIVAIQKLIAEVQHLRTHLTDEGGPRGN